MRQIERGIESVLFFSRWLIAPFLFGLLCCVVLLIYRFFANLYDLAGRLPSLSWQNLVVEVLNLVDVSLTANLVLIVVFSGYENFVHKRERDGRSGWPDGLIDVDFAALKQKLLGSIVVIAAVDALAWYLDLEKYADTSKLGWVLAFPILLVAVMVMLAMADWLGRRNNKVG